MSTTYKVLWIDDNCNEMKTIVSNIFVKLWAEDIRSDIYIFGDFALRSNDIQRNDEISELESAIYDKFVSFLIEKDFINNDDKIKEKWSLISSKKYNGQEINFDIVKNKKSLLDKHRECIDMWKRINSLEDKKDKEENLEDLTQNLTDDLLKDLNGVNVILLDLCLLEKDFDKLCSVSQGKNIPILSMGLYNALKKNEKYTIFLYSSFIAPNDLINGWIEHYKELYGDSNSEIVVYNRNGEDATGLSAKKILFDEIIETMRKDEIK